jgi:quercetin dioxygenase-like cupin family protein
MRTWNLMEIEAPDGVRDPVVLNSDEEARAVLIRLAAGQRMGEHQVKERAWICVLEGSVRVGAVDEEVEGGPGTLFRFDVDERRSIESDSGARILILFAPWPGEGHYRGGGGPPLRTG